MWVMLGLMPNAGLAQLILGLGLLAIIASPFIFAYQGLAYINDIASGPGMVISGLMFLAALILFFGVMPIGLARKKFVFALSAAVLSALMVTYILKVAPINSAMMTYYDLGGNPTLYGDADKRGYDFLRKFGVEGYHFKGMNADVEAFIARRDFNKLCVSTIVDPDYRGNEGFAALNKKRAEMKLPDYTAEQRASCSDPEKVKETLKYDIAAVLAEDFADMKKGYDLMASGKVTCNQEGTAPCAQINAYITQVITDGLPIHGFQSRGAKSVMVPSLDPGEETRTDPWSGMNREMWRRAVADLKRNKGMTEALCALDQECRWLLKHNIKFKN